mgnify:FL=1
MNQLGSLVIASSFATFVSGRVWGQLSDRSTPAVLALAGLAAGVVLLVTASLAKSSIFQSGWFLPLVLFVVMVAYQGVRIARSIHLVNLATEETRAAYTALSNTIIGLVLLGTGLFGVLAELIGVREVVIVLAVISLACFIFSCRLAKP